MMTNNENVFKKKSTNYFNKKAAVYDQSSSMRISPDLMSVLLNKLTSYPQPYSLLDIGCGTGVMLAQLPNRINASLAGLDISPEMLAVARKKIDGEVDLRIGDSESLPWKPATFDVVICTLSFHHYPNPGQALSEMRRVLKPGGMVLLADIFMDDPLRPLVNLILPFLSTGDRHFYSYTEIFKLMKEAGFVSLDWQKPDESAFLVSAYAPQA
jgi:ubiquinone/menaquinone biosynthesis C-methylase UbiE